MIKSWQVGLRETLDNQHHNERLYLFRMTIENELDQASKGGMIQFKTG